MGEMRDSDWSRRNLLRSDWLLPSVAMYTTRARLKKMADKREENSRKPRKLSKVETRNLTETLSRILLPYTTRAKLNIMKPTNVLATT